MPDIKDTSQIVDVVRNFSSTQLVAVGIIISATVYAVNFIEDRYAKNKSIEKAIEDTHRQIDLINAELKTQVTTLGVLTGQIQAIMNSQFSGRFVQPTVIPKNVTMITEEEKKWIEANRPKIQENKEAVEVQNNLTTQLVEINKQLERLRGAAKQ